MRKDRLHDAPGGGVAAWVSDNLVVNRRHDLELPDTESLWLEVRSHNNKLVTQCAQMISHGIMGHLGV